MLKQVSITLLIAAVLFWSGVFAFATPCPFFYLFVVGGRRAGWIATACAAVLITGLYFSRIALFGVEVIGSLGHFLLIAVLLGEGALRKWKFLKLTLTAILVVFGAIILELVALKLVFGFSIINGFSAYLTSVMNEAMSMQEAAKAISPAQMAYIKEHLSEFVGFAVGLSPAVAFLACVFIVAMTIIITRSFVRKSKKLLYLGNLSAIELPFALVWAAIACGTAYFVSVYVINNAHLKFVALNGLIVCAGGFFVQGCTVVAFWLQRRKSPFLRLVVYGLAIFFMQATGFFIVVLGLSDQWVNFRKRMAINCTNN